MQGYDTGSASGYADPCVIYAFGAEPSNAPNSSDADRTALIAHSPSTIALDTSYISAKVDVLLGTAQTGIHNVKICEAANHEVCRFAYVYKGDTAVNVSGSGTSTDPFVYTFDQTPQGVDEAHPVFNTDGTVATMWQASPPSAPPIHPPYLPPSPPPPSPSPGLPPSHPDVCANLGFSFLDSSAGGIGSGNGDLGVHGAIISTISYQGAADLKGSSGFTLFEDLEACCVACVQMSKFRNRLNPVILPFECFDIRSTHT